MLPLPLLTTSLPLAQSFLLTLSYPSSLTLPLPLFLDWYYLTYYPDRISCSSSLLLLLPTLLSTPPAPLPTAHPCHSIHLPCHTPTPPSLQLLSMAVWLSLRESLQYCAMWTRWAVLPTVRWWGQYVLAWLSTRWRVCFSTSAMPEEAWGVSRTLVYVPGKSNTWCSHFVSLNGKGSPYFCGIDRYSIVSVVVVLDRSVLVVLN